MHKSPLRYPGGKSRAVKFLYNYLPEFTEFREVFFGGGSLSFHLLHHYPDCFYTASDLNFELYCFWTQLKTNSQEVIEGVQAVYDEYKVKQLRGEDSYGDGKRLFGSILERRNDDLSDLQRAIDFYVLNRITFSGVVDSGGYSQGSFEGRFTQSSIDKLYPTSRVIQKIDFFCEDYTYLLNKPGDNVLIFLDPPYYSATKSKLYGRNGILHTTFDHLKLFENLRNAEHKWLITYDNSDFIKDLYKDFSQLEWKLQYGMTNRNNATSRAGNEILIANYDLSAVSVPAPIRTCSLAS